MIHSIIATTPESKALREGTQTLWLIKMKPQPFEPDELFPSKCDADYWLPEHVGKWIYPTKDGEFFDFPPFGKSLAVRENWAQDSVHSDLGTHHLPIAYRADCETPELFSWRSSASMPIKYARTHLEVIGAGILRLGDITNDDIIKLGLGSPLKTPLLHGYVTEEWNMDCMGIKYNQKHGAGAFNRDKDEWFWKLTLKRIEK